MPDGVDKTIILVYTAYAESLEVGCSLAWLKNKLIFF
jgi:hypothetical protein